MGDDEQKTDLTDDEIAVETRSVDVHARLMALEIQRRRAANRDMDAIKAGLVAEIESTPEIRDALTREMATYRLMANLGVRELRWGESEIGQLYAKLSPAATEVNDRYIAAIAAEVAFSAGEGVLLRTRAGITSKVLLEQHRLEAEVVRKRGEAAIEFERIVLPEIVQLIEGKERAFQVALAKEKQAPAKARKEGKL